MPLDPGLGSSSGQQTGAIDNVGQQTGTLNQVQLPDDPHENEPEIYEPEEFPDTENETAPGEFVGVFERTGTHILRSYLVPWDNYFVHVQRFLGFSRMNGGTLERLLPYTDYQHRNMHCTRVEVRGVGYRGGEVADQIPLTSTNVYRWARLICQFSTIPYHLGKRTNFSGEYSIQAGGEDENLGTQPDVETQRYCFKEVRPAIEYVTTKPGFLVWEDTGADINFPVPFMQSFEDVTVTWYDLPREAFPYDAIAECQGKVNDDALELPGFPPPEIYPNETLLLQSHSTRLTFFPNGLEACDLTYFFKHRPTGFNSFLDQSGTYRQIKRKGTSTRLFAEADFKTLFQPQP
jgi:hypothetical protein